MTATPVPSPGAHDRATHGADSEVGRLQTVMLHRPGPELKRLTPRNNDELLFDAIPWVARAQDEHDAFAGALTSRGVEVLYLTDLLTEALELPEARAHAIDEALADLDLGDTMRAHLAGVLGDADPAELTQHLTAGIRNDEVRGGFGLVTSLLAPDDFLDRPAAQPAVHPRLQRVDPRPGGDHLAGDAGAPPGDRAHRARSTPTTPASRPPRASTAPTTSTSRAATCCCSRPA